MHDQEKQYGDELFIYAMALLEEKENKPPEEEDREEEGGQ